MTEDHQGRLRRARAAFAEDGAVDASIRQSVIEAWRRSKAAGVASSGTPPVTIDDSFDRESPLLRAVEPITHRLLTQFGSTDIAMMVIDREARVVGRWTSGRLLEAGLDDAGSVPGRLFDEAVIGSTGLGSVLEVRNSVVIDGAEHWNETFDSLTAVGAPIIHPATGVVEGAIDVVCAAGAPVGLMLPLAELAARESADRMLSGYARDDRELLDAFLQSERRGPRRPVVALNERMVLQNRRAEALLRGRPEALTWADVERALIDGHHELMLGDAPALPAVVARIREVRSASGARGAVVQLVEQSPPPPRPVPTTTARAKPVVQPPSCPPDDTMTRDRALLTEKVRQRAAGRSLAWQAVIQSAVNAVYPGGRLLLTGPSGSGKTHLATALADSAGRSVHLNLGSALQSSAGEFDVVVLDDGASLRDPANLNALRRWLHTMETSAPHALVIATLTDDSDAPGELMAAFDDIVSLPALAFRLSDIDELIDAWAHDRRPLRVDASARRRLAERSWPGNVRQLHRALSVAAERSDGHVIRVGDLPAGSASTAPRRPLTYLENVERTAIAALLEATGGNKKLVAVELGVSRATLYRKMAALRLSE